MYAYNAGQPRQETQELYLTDGKSLSVSNGRFPNRTLYLQNVPKGHWYHFYIVSCSLLWRKVHVSKLKHHHVTYSPTSTVFPASDDMPWKQEFKSSPKGGGGMACGNILLV